MKLTDSRAMRDADSEAIHVLGIPSTLLMTNAATKLSKAALEFLGSQKKVAVFAGSGNNGGDGICAATQLLRRGALVRCFLVGSRNKQTADCAEMERRLIELGGNLETFDPFDSSQRGFVLEADVIVDAIFGIGLTSPLQDTAKAAVELINSATATIIAADIASGVHADTGAILGCAVKADVTVTFSMAKPGHFVEPGCECCGQLRIADIGVPPELLEKAKTNISVIMPDEISLARRARISHKGDYGRLLVIGGSVGYSGAPVLCCEAALRSGAGLISLGVPNDIYSHTTPRLLEAMCFPLTGDGNGRLSEESLPLILEKLENSTVGVIGCGLGRSEGLDGLVRGILQQSETPLVIDADGLSALGDNADIIRHAKTAPVLTPHEGEFLRLGGKLTGNRLSNALSFAETRNCPLVLKGHRVICAFPDGETFIIPAGNPGMAKGGSGDILAGLIGGLMCQLPLKTAVVTACMIHALAGDRAAERFGEYSMLPRDIISAIPEIMLQITDSQGKEWSK